MAVHARFRTAVGSDYGVINWSEQWPRVLIDLFWVVAYRRRSGNWTREHYGQLQLSALSNGPSAPAHAGKFAHLGPNLLHLTALLPAAAPSFAAGPDAWTITALLQP